MELQGGVDEEEFMDILIKEEKYYCWSPKQGGEIINTANIFVHDRIENSVEL